MGRIWSALSTAVKRRLALASGGCVALPWLGGELAKTFYQPGLTPDPARAALLIDFLVIGCMLFALTMLLTVTMGCLITAVMKGPRHFGDPFPSAGRDD